MNRMILNHEIYEQGLVKYMVNKGGLFKPLVIDFPRSSGVALMNPSIFNDNGKYIGNLRCVNYVLHHSEKNMLPHWDGPLQYVHPENDVRLGTENYLIELNENLDITKSTFIEMNLNTEPVWGFTGLEDARVIKWDGKLYICGVRRDVKDNGEGRMELSELDYDGYRAIEINRDRIPSNDEDDDEYCVKNMGAIIDRPYTFVKWYSPTEIQYYDIKNKKVSSVWTNRYNTKIDVRGGSQVIPWNDYYLCIGHSVRLWKPYSGSKDSCYQAHLIVWDKEFNLLYISDEFKYLNAQIEFTCGLCNANDGDLIVTFGYMDNASYALKFNPNYLFE